MTVIKVRAKPLSTRRQARILTIQALYAYELNKEQDVSLLFTSLWKDEGVNSQKRMPESLKNYALVLYGLFKEHQIEIDDLIEKYSLNWTLKTANKVDLAIIRVGATELLYKPDVPCSVVMNEAIDLSKLLSTESSKRFINGVLDSIRKKEVMLARDNYEAKTRE